jgi:hypothetical protein
MLSTRITRSSFGFVLFLALLLGIQAIAQTAVDGAIGGTVNDTSGAVIPGATVLVHNNDTNAEQTVKTDSSGYFRALHLRAGLYSVTVTASGFGTFKSPNVSVQVGSLTDMPVKLSVGATQQSVEVTDTQPAVNTTGPDFASFIDQRVLNDLPVNNYRWSAYALQTPNVVESGGFGLLSFRGQGTLLNNITVDGADNNQAFFSEERGRTTVGYSTAKVAVQEFQVNTSNYSVEYGRASGGVVNAVTKAGGNTFHGESYYLDRDSALAAQNDYTAKPVQLVPGGPFTNQKFKATDIRKQYGVGVGGPIIKDKLFFFLAADGYYRHFPAVAVASNPTLFFAAPSAALPAGQTCGTINSTNDSNFTLDSNACTLQTNLALPTYAAAVTNYNQGLAGIGSMLGQGPRYSSQTIFFPKIDWQINQKNHASFEFNRLRFVSPGGQQTNATANFGLQSFGNIYVRDTWGIAKLDSYITSNISNEVRYQYGRDFNFGHNMPATPYEKTALLTTPTYTNPNGIPPAVAITNGFSFGTPTFYNRPAFPDESRWQVSDTVQWTRGHHNFKFGVDYIHTNDLSINLTSVFGSYSYGNSGSTTAVTQYLTDFYLSQNPATASRANHYTSYQQGFGPLGFEFTTSDYAFFFQDEWKVIPRLSLTLGLRYELEQLPNPQLPNPLIPQTLTFPSDKNNIAPRVGFAYDVFGKGNTVVRGGYGIFNARLMNSTIYNALAQTGLSAGQSVINLSANQAGAPIFPQIIATAAGTRPPPSVVYFDPHFQKPQIHQADLNVEQRIGWNTVLTVSWLASLGRELPNYLDTNIPVPTSVSYTIVNNGITTAPLKDGTVFTTPFYGFASSPIAGAVPAPVNQGRPNPLFSSMTAVFSGVNTNYEAMVVKVDHRMAHNLQFQANYTWSHALDYGQNNTTFTTVNAVLDPTNLRTDYGNSGQNVPNRLVVTAIATSPWHAKGWMSYLLNDFEFSPSFAAQNGVPYSASISGATTNLADSAYPSGFATGISNSYNGTSFTFGSVRAPILHRNAFRQPPTYVMDARVSKRIVYRERYQLEFLAEAFNLFNHQNVTAVNTTVYSIGATRNLVTPSLSVNTLSASTANGVFGAPTNSNSNNIYTPRQLQLGARIRF